MWWRLKENADVCGDPEGRKTADISRKRYELKNQCELPQDKTQCLERTAFLPKILCTAAYPQKTTQWSSMTCGYCWGSHGEELPKLLELLLELGSEARVVGDHHVLVIVLARLLRPIEAAVEEDDAV